MIIPAQIRGARAMLDMTQAQLAKAAGLSTTGLLNIENGTSVAKEATLARILKALEDAGIDFVNHGRPGVRLRSRPGDASKRGRCEE